MSISIDSILMRRALRKLAMLPRTARRRVFGTWAAHMAEALNSRAPAKLGGSFRASYNDKQAVAGSPRVWARITHYGGRIVASGSSAYKAPRPPLASRAGSTSEVTGKPIKFLAIPINRAAENKRPRDFAGLNSFVFKSKKGNLLIAQRLSSIGQGKTGFLIRSGATSKRQKNTRGERKAGMRLLFVLKKAIQIPKRPYANIRPDEKQLLADLITAEARDQLRNP